MKYKGLPFYLFLLFLCLPHLLYAHEVSILECLEKIAHGGSSEFVCGWERLPGSDSVPNTDMVPDSDVLQRALQSRDIMVLHDYILKNSSYDCLIGSAFILVYPKGDANHHETVLVKRIIEEKAGHFQLVQLLGDLHGAEQGNPVNFTIQEPYRMNQHVVDGPVVLQGGKFPCYEVLNDLATQVKSPFWIINHIDMVDIKTHKSLFPMNFGDGLIYFYPAPH